MSGRTTRKLGRAERTRAQGRRNLRKLILLLVAFALLALVLGSIGLLNLVDVDLPGALAPVAVASAGLVAVPGPPGTAR